MKKQYTFRWIIFSVCVFIISGVYSIQAGDRKDMGGWGINDPYNKLYNAAEVERIKVVVTEVKEVIAIPGMSPGVALIVLWLSKKGVKVMKF